MEMHMTYRGNTVQEAANNALDLRRITSKSDLPCAKLQFHQHQSQIHEVLKESNNPRGRSRQEISNRTKRIIQQKTKLAGHFNLYSHCKIFIIGHSEIYFISEIAFYRRNENPMMDMI